MLGTEQWMLGLGAGGWPLDAGAGAAGSWIMETGLWALVARFGALAQVAYFRHACMQAGSGPEKQKGGLSLVLFPPHQICNIQNPVSSIQYRVSSIEYPASSIVFEFSIGGFFLWFCRQRFAFRF